MKLFPIPQTCKKADGHRNLMDATWIILPPQADFPLKKRIMELARELNGQTGLALRVTAGIPSSNSLMVRMERQEGLPAEGYRLTLKDQGPFRLQASDDPGFFYGMQTLAQLLEDPSNVPCVTIEDHPSLAERGYMLDISRCKVPTMDTMKDMVRSLARLRYNALQLYMEHTFAFAAHERVWGGFTPFTSEEIMELDAFCHDHFIELVPNINSFGHLQRWLCLDEYKPMAEYPQPEGPGMVLEPTRKSLEFMDALYAEFLPNFTSRKVNIGCDETVELGKGKSAAECKRKGVTRVYLDFLTKLAAKAKARGFSVQFWGDIIMHNPELIPELPQGITALEWGYEANHPFAKDTELFRKSGVDFLICPGTSSWLTTLGRTTNMIANLENAVTNGSRNGAKGILMTDWGDGGHFQYYPISWAGLTMGGGAAWNAASPQTKEELPYGIAMAFAPGKEGVRLAKLLLEMGRVYDDFTTRVGNSTPFGRIMTNYKSMYPFLPKLSRAEVRKALKHTEKLYRELTQHPFPTMPLVNAELDNGLRLALAGLVFMQRAIGGTWDRAKWLDDMRHIVATHEQLWLSRNRSGGLHESSAKLRADMDMDPDAWKDATPKA